MLKQAGKKLGKWLALVFLLMSTALATNVPPSRAAEGTQLTDYDQQALYIVKLGMSYVEWPSLANTPEGLKVINVCVVGSNPGFVSALQKFQAAAAKKLKINIGEIEDNGNLAACNIAYVPKNKANFKDIIGAAKQWPVLTVSPIKGFAASGGMVELSVSESDNSGAPTNTKATVSYAVNNKMATAANLKISSEFLEFAAEVIR